MRPAPKRGVDKDVAQRIIQVREHFGLKKSPFAETIGYKPSGYSQVESGINNATPQLLNAICNRYKVSLNWLQTGEGEMLISDDPIRDLCAQYNLSDRAASILEGYLEMDDEDREKLIELMESIVNRHSERKKTSNKPSRIDSDADSNAEEIGETDFKNLRHAG